MSGLAFLESVGAWQCRDSVFLSRCQTSHTRCLVLVLRSLRGWTPGHGRTGCSDVRFETGQGTADLTRVTQDAGSASGRLELSPVRRG